MMMEDNADDYQALLEAGRQNAAYQAEMEKQKALAARLRGGPELEGQMVSGHYVAPNILELIGDTMQKRRANKADEAHSAATSGLNDSMSKQNQMILARILRAQQQSQLQTPPQGFTGPIDQQQPPQITPDMAARARQQGMMDY